MDSITPRRAARRRGLREVLRWERPLVVTVVIALAVGGLAGAAIGWKVEQRRVESEIVTLRPMGRIDRVGGDVVTVRLTSAEGTRDFRLTDDTVVQRAGVGTPADLVRGARVFVRVSPDAASELEAAEIVVLAEPGTG
jgi:hypothetical protein